MPDPNVAARPILVRKRWIRKGRVRARQIRKRRRNWESRSDQGRRASGAGSSCRYAIREIVSSLNRD